MTKRANVEPAIFTTFVKKMLDKARAEDVGEYDETDPNAPYRDSDLNKMLGKDRLKSPNKNEEIPRKDFQRPDFFRSDKSAGSSLVSRILAAHTGRRFQQMIDKATGRHAKE